MEDPLLEATRISNPSTLSFFEKDGKRIVLLGDIHTPRVKECARCKEPTCYDYLGLINALDKYHKSNSTDLDVFVETFAPNYPKDRLGLYWYGAKEKFKKAMIPSLNLNLFRARTNLFSKLFLHGRDPSIQQRYHYTDFRLSKIFEDYGFSITTIFDVLQSNEFSKRNDEEKANFFSLYPTKTKFINILKEFMFGKPFDKSYPHRNLLSHGMTRIAKQFYKLKSSHDQKIIKSFTLSKINKMANEIYFDKNIPDKWSNSKEPFILKLFNCMFLFMDTYAICRFVRYFREQSPGSTSVFLAGAAHCRNYREFLKKWGAKETVYKETYSRKEAEINPDKMLNASKCISLKKTRRNRKKLT